MDWIQWGNVPEIVAAVVTVVAAGVAILSRLDSKRSVVEARRSADAAEQANVEARRSADAAERSAHVDEQTLADERAAAAPKVDLVIEPRQVPPHQMRAFRIRNAGGKPAVGVRILDCPGSVLPVDESPGSFPDERDLGALGEDDSWDFYIYEGLQQGPLPTLRVTWEGQAEPVNLPMP